MSVVEDFRTENVAFEALYKSKGIVPEVSTSWLSHTFARITTALTTALGTAPKLTNKKTLECIDAGRAVQNALFDKATTSNEQLVCLDNLKALRAEAAEIINTKWAEREKEYAPLTQAIIDATDNLKDSKKRADQIADALNLGADVLNLFGKFLSVLG